MRYKSPTSVEFRILPSEAVSDQIQLGLRGINRDPGPKAGQEVDETGAAILHPRVVPVLTKGRVFVVAFVHQLKSRAYDPDHRVTRSHSKVLLRPSEQASINRLR